MLLLPLLLSAQETKKSNSAWASTFLFWGDTTWMDTFQGPGRNCSFHDFPFCGKKEKFNGHWAGFEMGVGGYVNSDFNMNFNTGAPYLNMNTARSLMLNFNLWELNLNLVDNKFGFISGLGFQVSNYYFTDNYVMLQDSATLVAYKVVDENGYAQSMKTNKLVVSHLNLPLLFEFQTNRYRRASSFHVSAGVIAGVRIGSYTKQAYNMKEGTLYLIDGQGNSFARFDVEHHKVHDRGPYHLSPFKLDAAFRIGWSYINLFSTFSLTPMFQKDRGPEAYPFTVGLTLLGW